MLWGVDHGNGSLHFLTMPPLPGHEADIQHKAAPWPVNPESSTACKFHIYVFLTAM